MNITLWIVQGLLAVAALVHAWLFIVWPAALVEKLQQSTPTPKQEAVDVSPGFRRFIGVAELLAAVGLIFPGLTGILPWLTPLAAFGMMIVLAGAVVFHLRRGETHRIPPVTTLFAMAAVVAYMRWQVLPL